jgi:hypothetical protein
MFDRRFDFRENHLPFARSHAVVDYHLRQTRLLSMKSDSVAEKVRPENPGGLSTVGKSEIIDGRANRIESNEASSRDLHSHDRAGCLDRGLPVLQYLADSPIQHMNRQLLSFS